MSSKDISTVRGVYPGGTNPDVIHLVGAIVTWWARIEGMMVSDIMTLRTQPFSSSIANSEAFPKQGKPIIGHWRKLLVNGYGEASETVSEIDNACRIARELIDHRNNLLHSFWPFGQVDPGVVELQWITPDPKSPYGARIGVYQKSIVELDEINDRLAHLYNMVMCISMNSHALYPKAHI